MNVGEVAFKLSVAFYVLIRSLIATCFFYAIGEVSSYWLKIALLSIFTAYTTLSVYGLYRNLKNFFTLKKLFDNKN